MKQHKFYPITTKKEGDRVKLPVHPASPNTKYYYGTVIYVAMVDQLMVRWDHPIDHLPRVSTLHPAILV